jgi:2-keto-3-deoxy-L-fuconate dehydrogenase
MGEAERDFEDIAAVVTGGASGIGDATVRALIGRGARVAALDVDPENACDSALRVAADVSDRSSVDQSIAHAAAELGAIDVLVNNAGIGAVGGIEDNDDGEWRRVLDVNLMGVVHTSRAALPHLRRSGRGAVVNVSSVAATVGLPQRACYSASKGAVLSLTLAMAADLVDEGIRVNCVCPGTIDTPWVGRLLAAAHDPAAHRAALEGRQPMGRLGAAAEVATAILFLASPTSSFVTGTALAVDGGLTGLRLPASPSRA